MERDKRCVDEDPCVVNLHLKRVVWPPYHIEDDACLLHQHCSGEKQSWHMSVSCHEVLNNLWHHDRHTEDENQPSVIDNLFHKHESDDHRRIKLDVKIHKTSSDSYISLREEILILVFPALNDQSKLEQEQDHEKDQPHNHQ